MRFHLRHAAEIPARKVNLAHRGRLALKVRRASQVRKDRRALKVLQEKKEKRAIKATKVTRVMRPPSNLVPSRATDL